MNRRILVIVPTESESAGFDKLFPCRMAAMDQLRGYNSVEAPVVTGGVGMAAMSFATAAALTAYRPDMLILAGIAGAYPGTSAAVGQSYIVRSETVADQGAFREGIFTPLYRATFDCPFAGEVEGLPAAASNTVNCGGAGFVLDHRGGAELENMEGAAFFAVCSAHGIPFYQVRAVSNFTTDPRSGWRMDEAVESLGKALKLLTDEIAG